MTDPGPPIRYEERMRLAKDHLDVGFSTGDWPAADAFWRTVVGLPYEEYLKIGAGVRQHRFGCNGSVVKVNHAREPLAPATTVLRGLRIAHDRTAMPVRLHEPEGTPIELVPRGHDGVTGIEVSIACADGGSARRFWVDGLGGTLRPDGRVQVGDTLIRTASEPDLTPMTARTGPGFRYLTVQVWNCDAAHAHLLDLGFAEDLAPFTLGTTARISFVRNDDGLPLEISQRASLTGALPDPDGGHP